jgi:hypothetical protein
LLPNRAPGTTRLLPAAVSAQQERYNNNDENEFRRNSSEYTHPPASATRQETPSTNTPSEMCVEKAFRKDSEKRPLFVPASF